MNWDVNYLLQNFVITFCVSVFIPVFLLKNETISVQIKRYFLFLVAALLIEGLESYFDHVLGLVPDNRYEKLRIFVSAIGYSIRPIMMYIVLLIITRRSTNKYHSFLLLLPSLVTIIISFSAFFTPLSFSYDANNIFHGGPLRNVMYVVLVFYYVMLIFFTVYYSRKDVNETKILIGILFLVLFDTAMGFIFKNYSSHCPIMALAVLLYFMYFSAISHKEQVVNLNTNFIETEAFLTQKMLNQSIETLAYTIDAKDRYTRGHSFRVAKYARQIAKLADKNDEECRQIYLTGLLHDIGKISVRDDIINKKGELTAEEYDQIKQHPVNGGKILEKMVDFPFLISGAKYHHEHYDGTGYPKGLKGENIPEFARIIAVADAYDAMTSHRSYRNTMDQIDVKEEIWKGIGTQFDPKFAKLMIALIDADFKYEMREKHEQEDEVFKDVDTEDVVWIGYEPKKIRMEADFRNEKRFPTLGSLVQFVNYWAKAEKSIQITENLAVIKFHAQTWEDAKYIWNAPIAIVYSSKDGLVDGEDYEELGVFEIAGYSWRVGSALTENSSFTKTPKFESWDNWLAKNKIGMDFKFSAVRKENEIFLKLENELIILDGKLVLPKNFNKAVYFAVSGEKCFIS